MRYGPRAILACGLGFAAAFLVACGGGAGLLSGNQSSALSAQADQISSAVQSGNCGAAVSASSVLGGDVQNLPVTINPTLRSNLSQGASTIAQLAATDCRHHTTSTQSAPTSSSTTSSTSSSSSSTTTSSSTSTPTSSSTSTTSSTSATTPSNTGTTSTTTGGAGLGGGTTPTTGNGNGIGTSGGAGPGNGNGTGGGG